MGFEKIAGGITAVSGFMAAGIHCGIKKSKKDLALIYSATPATSAGVFTKNLFQAAPVLLTRERIKNKLQAIIINSGNANACTGEKGLEDARAMAAYTARALGIPEESVAVSSTGVIGEYLPMEKIIAGIKDICSCLSAEGGPQAAEAIMTTDTVPKEAAVRGKIKGLPFSVGGIAKGSGMICPNMATMLAFIGTDLQIERELLQKTLKEVVNRTFNMITVDGDTSTNDTVLLLANGQAGITIEAPGPELDTFKEALLAVSAKLAKMIVRDGEGATKVIALKIKGCPDFASGRQMAMAVLNSNLVKTAIFGKDANWGRIVTAMGYSGVDFEPSKVEVNLGHLPVARNGRGLAFSEEEALTVLEQDEIPITINLNLGTTEVEAWGTDLSYEYVRINAEYRS
ncbi:MAG: bifunctional glutamate N-acetyltransferase/amino-acid acetyltransferase ArgJ [Firmicutes bacterium]|nr:bifunctional glutamate N-acetyltransferase/amino-acid acetyltransferase ArgJ [Bacillota bacterium]